MKLAHKYLADLLNGDGLRDCYFFSGCELHCSGCFSPETWEPNMPQAKLWTEEDFQELIVNASKPYISGITLLGGDPFHPVNREEILDLCRRFKGHFGDSRTIWVYTGYIWETIEKSKDARYECLKYIDVLCDGPFIEKLKSPTKPWVGSENQRVIDVKRSLNTGSIVSWI